MSDLAHLLPEGVIAVTLGGVLLSEAGYYGERTRLVTLAAAIGLATALVQTLIAYGQVSGPAVGGAIMVDGLSQFFRVLAIVTGLLAIGAVALGGRLEAENRSEYVALVLTTTLGTCLAGMAADSLLTFLSLLVVNVSLNFLAGFSKANARSSEAAIKRMLFGIVSSLLFAYGVAILFAQTRSLNIYEMHRALTASPASPAATLVTFLLLFATVCYLISAFPMSLWTPDVMEGSPTSAVGFLSVASRLTGFAIAIRYLLVVFSTKGSEPGQWVVLGEVHWTGIVGGVAGATMGVGAWLALRQGNVKRLIGCLGIVQAGYLLLGLIVLDEVGVAAILYNLVLDAFALSGAYFVLSLLLDRAGTEEFGRLGGLFHRAMPECICLFLFLASIVGLPPLPGFIGKFTLVGAAVRHSQFFLAVLALVSSVLSIAAVAKLAYSLVGSDPTRLGTGEASLGISRAQRIFLVALIGSLVLLGVFAESVLGWAGRSLRFILW